MIFLVGWFTPKIISIFHVTMSWCTYWCLWPGGELCQNWARSLDDLVGRCVSLPVDVCPTSIDQCLLGRVGDARRVHMLHWPYCDDAELEPFKVINVIGTRILVDRNMMETPVPGCCERDIFSQCAHGYVVFFALDKSDELVDYPLSVLTNEWPLFFVNHHPATSGSPLLHINYFSLCDVEVCKRIATNVLREKWTGVVSQRIRVESVVIAHFIVSYDPVRWFRAAQFKRAVQVIECDAPAVPSRLTRV